MKIAAVTPYLGQKRTMAPGIIDLLTDGGAIEPTLFYEGLHGSLAALLELRRRGWDGKAIANDLYGLMHNLAFVIATRETFDWLMGQVVVLPLSESVFWSSCDRLQHAQETPGRMSALRSRMDQEIARDYLIASWMGRNGEAGSEKEHNWADVMKGFCTRYTTSGGDPAVRWRAVIESMPDWYHALSKRTHFTCRDVLKQLPSIPDEPGTCIYLDPPYLRDTRTAGYAVDVEDGTGTFYEPDDWYAQLAEAVGRFKQARIVLSFYQHERLERLFPSSTSGGGGGGWSHIDAARAKHLSAPTADVVTEAPEVLICNFAQGLFPCVSSRKAVGA